MLDFYHEGKRTEYFDLWTEYLPENIRNNDTVAEKLEFYLNIFFAIYPIKQGREGEVSNCMLCFFCWIELHYFVCVMDFCYTCNG